MPTVTTYPGVFGPYTPITFTRASTATYFDSTGTLQSAAIDVPRLDYNPSTLAAQGFLVEEARTNSIRNNTMQGAVAGTPGTLPTNWGGTGSPVNGLTRQVVGTGTESGITYIDIRYSGTTTSTSFHGLNEEPLGAIAALSGQTWTHTVYISVVGGSTANINVFDVGINEYSSVPAYLVGSSVSITLSAGALVGKRFALVRTLTNASTASIQPFIAFTYNSGVAIDITIRIGLPQLENNNISTGVASATVAAGGTGYAVGDVLEINGGTGTKARVTVATLSGSAVATVTVSTAGSYSVFPSPQPVSVTAITGTGSSATFNIVPQTQTGFATSVIPTTTTALTRSADVASVNTLSPWFNASASTILADYTLLTSRTTDVTFARFDDGSDANRIQVSTGASFTVFNSFVIVSNVSQGTNTVAINPLGTHKTAFAVTTNDSVTAADGTVGTPDTTVTLPSGLTRFSLGNSNAAQFFNGYLRRITYYPRRLTNAELVSITT